MKKLYAIPGLGVDERLFKNILIPGFELIPVKWITPLKGERLEDYAGRLAQQIDKHEPFYLIGVSFGGMCAVEIAKKYFPLRTIIISSAKGPADLPWYFKVFRFIPIHRLVSDNTAIRLALRFRGMFGVKDGEQKKLFDEMLRTAPANYYARAINCIVHWRNKEVPGDLSHLHGTCDRIIPLRFVKNPTTIKNGSHFMVLNSADEINASLEKILTLSVRP
ncbi:MAG TPA: alpha/beta hydrolase [Bacteroidia bacterium]|jgi:pimeloyl-ACP methyl ester carboxylesterase